MKIVSLFGIIACLSISACNGDVKEQIDAGPKDANVQPDGHPDASATVKKRVFVTSTKTKADLKNAGAGVDGLDGAGKLCAAAVTAANLGGTWNVWLSTSSKNAIDQITGNGPWYLVDGTTLVFATKTALASNPMHEIDLDETGTLVSNSAADGVWTGTKPDGTANTTSLCSDWTLASGTPATSLVGGSGDSDSSWTQSPLSLGCTVGTARLYCFEI